MPPIKLWLIMSITFLLGCVGTDIVNDSSISIPARIEIAPKTAAVEIGQAVTFQATYFDTLGDEASETVFQWRSLSPALVTIDENGLATGRQAGQAMVVALAEGIQSAPALLTVVADANQVAQIVVAPDSGVLRIGETLQFTATALNLSGNEIFGKSFSWRSSDSEIVTITDTGLATAIATGNAEVVATTDGIESLSAFVEVLGQSRTGTFVPRPGTSYRVGGTATLAGVDGRLILSFGDDFTSSNGPGLEVFLSTSNRVDATSLNLGRLEETRGMQTYEVPASVELNTFDWVIIHCVPFRVTFGFAELN